MKEVISKLFDEETIENVQYLTLKKGIQLHTLDCVPTASFQKHKEPETGKKSKSSQVSHKKKQSEDKQLL